MLVFGKQTRLTFQEIMIIACDYFEGRMGLVLSSPISECCLTFRSPLGYVSVEIQNCGVKRDVTVRTMEYEYQAKEFAKKI
ncbi:MAG: hypothetical protein ACXADL_01880 [Candidatus Thorarchaeota archaeon]|jgi:hypothetical protein